MASHYLHLGQEIFTGKLPISITIGGLMHASAWRRADSRYRIRLRGENLHWRLSRIPMVWKTGGFVTMMAELEGTGGKY